MMSHVGSGGSGRPGQSLTFLTGNLVRCSDGDCTKYCK